MKKLNKPITQKEKTAAYKRRADFGITIADYDTMLFQQKGKCAICRKAQKCKAQISVM